MTFSALLPVHWTENLDFLRDSLESILENTCIPSEVIIVWDGIPGKDLLAVADNYSSRLPIRTITRKTSIGLGPALAEGVMACSHEWIARVDSDDVCMRDRFERQLEFIRQNPDIDAFSSPMIEFSVAPDQGPLRLKKVPMHYQEILSYARWRNPLNHPAVMMRKSAVLRAGNYMNERFFEDYSLWVRMLQAGARLANMEEPVVYARAGQGMQRRRGGLEYLRREVSMLRRMHASGFLSTRDFMVSIMLKAPIRLLPPSLRHHFYGTILRG